MSWFRAIRCPAAYIVIALGGRGVSTPTAYRMLDDRYGCDLDRDFADVSALTGAAPPKKPLGNIIVSLQCVRRRHSPRARRCTPRQGNASEIRRARSAYERKRTWPCSEFSTMKRQVSRRLTACAKRSTAYSYARHRPSASLIRLSKAYAGIRNPREVSAFRS